MTTTEQLSALSSILAQSGLHSLFQPIISLSERRILGYEALSRGPSNSPLHSPVALFAVARQAGRLSELEIACRQSACKRFSEQQLPGKLFLNVSPESLLEAAHQPGRTLQLLEDFGIPPSQVVIELTEQTPIDDFQLLQNALHHYRDMGFSIALDDLGAGYSSLRLWSELRPDYVKIDRHFIDGIHQDALKREFVGSILQIAKASRAQVIAEGIELTEELAVLTEMGVDLVQGYLLCRPQEQPPRDARAMMPKHDHTSVALNDDGSDLSALLNEQPAVARNTPTANVLEAFRRQANLNSLAVLDEQGQPCGIVHRHSLSDALLKPFATDLFARKPISRLMNDDFLAVELSQSLQQVSRLITSRARQRIEEDFIITLNGHYLGLGRVIDVLKLITELKIQQARYANPLTLLPGNVPIQQSLSRLLQQARESVICYVDIDSFKPFNDIYGYGRGDEVLLCLAQCLNDRVDPSRDFVGHIGGDDFLLVLGPEDWRRRLNQLLDDFHSQCRRFYRSEHLEAGCFVAPNRQGIRQEFPLLSLSIGVVHLYPQACGQLDSSQLAELASQAKHHAKNIQGYSIHVIDSLEAAASLGAQNLSEPLRDQSADRAASV
ncbi:GGDEF domain-containing protein [Pseudomonas protegens]|jgi:diguanylate cyclase (GGDEF)-like protein|uniref:Cyclic diguanylate phosphodiesterase domain/CBS domain pair/diguanylate cyclase domain protein n=2 Tax=Pseudomonas protegens TaxID=380021 RepID=Q4K8E6_PSEF5|nr:bifunctional diguanylate cyclase/phosphodiesterase [Pseudomonas protegens]AAY93650.1 cyclic diguanylate phosphodiesterase domain/CBS domain pair/diguanylate cyclase domain protein [Pseudomonas protegens Pf-5]ASE22187.1 GGDEF domain-containing protein [Pseudomonas protegens]QEZ59667.1 GGDEF domain-containing protein [Pseudomonas protegens]QEZ65412.1 GGDEF domain-containing protein [Pseudomonas protegens]QIC30687.1 GGDEF domain-containing protein [Pseudomonas protegens]